LVSHTEVENIQCENSLLRRIFEPQREEVAVGWRRLYNEELHKLYASSNIARVIKWRRARLEGHVAHMERSELHTKLWSGNLKGRDQSEDLSVDGKNYKNRS
jgi:hypothetical protein